MQKTLKKFNNSYFRLILILFSSLWIFFNFIFKTTNIPIWFIQIIGIIYFFDAISILFDVYNKYLKNKIEKLEKQNDRWNEPKKKLETEHLVYFDDQMYLPISYHGILEKKPFFKGKGNHSVKQLEEICEQFKEFTHQQQIVKQNCMKHIIELKFGVVFS